jgi:hypothetical protein
MNGREALRRDLDRFRRDLAQAEGRRNWLRRRRETLEHDVALAKARLDLRGPVELFIEEVQAEASRRSLRSTETLLTAFAQDVLPGEKPVSLELSLPSGASPPSISASCAPTVRARTFWRTTAARSPTSSAQRCA